MRDSEGVQREEGPQVFRGSSLVDVVPDREVLLFIGVTSEETRRLEGVV